MSTSSEEKSLQDVYSTIARSDNHKPIVQDKPISEAVIHKTDTNVYLEGMNSKYHKDKPLPKSKDGAPKKAEFIEKSGPESVDGFKKPVKEEVEQEDNKKFSQGTKKDKEKKINTFKETPKMESMNNQSEFDRLCEDVLGPEDTELGINDDTDTSDAAENPGDAPTEDGAMDGEGDELKERVKRVFAELKEILVELGVDPCEECSEEPSDDLPGDDIEKPEGIDDGGESDSLATGEESPEIAREAVESEDLGTPITGMKKGNPTAVKGRANVVDGKASRVTKGKADGKIGKPGTGELESAPDGKSQVGKPKASQAANSKIRGKNQDLFNV